MSLSLDATVTHDLDAASSREWIEANGLGGWASGTVAGCHTRRYHGLLVAATKPPVGRMVLLSKLADTLVVDGTRHELDANFYPGAVHPRGFETLESFRLDPFPTFTYAAGGIRCVKTIAAVHGENTTLVTYELAEAPGPVTLELRPLIAYRDYHALQRANDAVAFANTTFDEGLFTARPYDGAPELHVAVPGATFEAHPDWYFRFEYPLEAERGLDSHEDLFCYGVFRRTLRPGERLGIVISTASVAGRDAFDLLERQRARRKVAAELAGPDDPLARALALAADAFVVRRGEDLRTIIAGYPWFTDWGRDTMIALPGLCLATGRHDDARKILRAFAAGVEDGLVPNRFPDAGGPAEYNTADASLWFFVAAHRYLEATNDAAFVTGELLPVLEEIVARHEAGTKFGIRVDDDGLLRAGDPGTQLTWMDAKVGEWVVTPRWGKPVEIQALWYNALTILGELKKDASLAQRAKAVKDRFVATFWNDEAGCLFDVVDGERRDASIRPNQIFALALPHPLLPKDKAKAVLAVVEEKLLTPYGLRSLAADDPSYRGRYLGGPGERDAAYHQGTVWSWLLGPYAEALVRTLGVTGKARARKALEGIAPHLHEAGLGTISEIFDGDAPHAPRGCPAQAWSVGEVLRVWRWLGAPAVATTKKKPYKVVTPTTVSSGRKTRSKSLDA
ncbi:MAG TPA: amylo-alpha-1,6-glucosidase [Candidatus Polarisedimenticolaceae bacterium]|nr:amylo-alpha-1,6-glucosidase [Candidatus Polarisedimenticolaceae bacterium]